MYNVLGPAPNMPGSGLGAASNTPAWMQPQPVTSPTAGVANMTKALFGSLGQMQQARQYADAVKRAQAYANPGQPLNIQSDAQQQSMLTTPPPSFSPGSSGGAIY